MNTNVREVLQAVKRAVMVFVVSGLLLGAVTPPHARTVRLYFVRMDDNGRHGKKIGCGDSLIPVSVQVPATGTTLDRAYGRLLSIHSEHFGNAGLYNALFRSRLHVVRTTLHNGRATVRLAGQISLGGECDDPRFESQLEEPALHLPGVRHVSVFINGRALADILSLKG